MFKFIRNKKSRLKFYHGFTIFMALLLISGSVLALTGSNIFAFVFSIILPILALINFFFLVFWLVKKSKCLGYPLLSLVTFFLCFNSFIQFNPKNEISDVNSISILTFNVNGVGLRDNKISNERIKKIVGFIEEQDSDVVILQECWNYGLDYFDKYKGYFLGYRENISKSLQVIVTKFPIVNYGYIDFPETFNNAMFVDIEFKDEIIRIYNVHLQSFWIKSDEDKGYTSKYSSRFTNLFRTISIAQKMRRNQTQLIMDHAKNFAGPIIICGDFNSTQFSSTYKNLKKNRRDTFLEAGFGLGTTYRLFTYPLRLDYVLVDNDFEVVSHKNFELNLSDHEPVMVELVKN